MTSSLYTCCPLYPYNEYFKWWCELTWPSCLMSVKLLCGVWWVSSAACQSVLLCHVGPPGEPAGVVGLNAKATSIELTWWPSKDNGRPVQYYIVEIFNTNEGYWKRQPDAPSLYTFDVVTNWLAESQLALLVLRKHIRLPQKQWNTQKVKASRETDRTRACIAFL